MVQLKYFGDSRDYFKYDLIAFLLDNGSLQNYAFIPMLTSNRIDKEGNKKSKYIDGKSKKLLEFINRSNSKDLGHWEKFLKPYVVQYKTIHPINKTFFSDATREAYWSKFEAISKTANALVFIDPDTGLETGKPAYLKKQGREKYIMNNELAGLFNNLDNGSVLMIYQHLPNNKHKHKEAVSKKIIQAEATTNCPYIEAYREDDLAFIFLIKSDVMHKSINKLLDIYHQQSGHKYKSIHHLSNKPFSLTI